MKCLHITFTIVILTNLFVASSVHAQVSQEALLKTHFFDHDAHYSVMQRKTQGHLDTQSLL